ncbi:GAP family protein [Agrococcus sp. ARC_14]|uniref:GAP family protein n=1 Tax=Agrococcus sp. ARC_14 TaxID=2919927 RepID=UPI001F056741|nr:GAP family protein [Agrococcus sp. ARC_14]MCH1881569.1 GAP family protein [Agrococcus sp. ARC_14]
MDLETLLPLVVLALIDSLSIGTLLVPVFFLLAPGGVRYGRVTLYLLTIAGFYFAVGVAVASGAGWIADGLESIGDSSPVTWLQLLLGVALLAGALVFGKSAPKPGTPEAEAILNRPAGRLARWRDAAMGDGGAVALVGVAVGAGVLELATMLPYLAAIGMLTTAALPLPQLLAVLAGYCAVMIAPALVLLLGRALLRGAVEPALQRLARWMQLNGAENTAWIVGIVGFLLLRDAASRLALFEQLGVVIG